MTETGPPMLNVEPQKLNGQDREPTAYNVEGYTVLRLQRGDQRSREIFRAFHERCMDFVDKINSDIDTIWLGKLLYAGMAESSNFVFMLAALDDQDRIVGHILAYPAEFERLGYVTLLLQVDKDHGVPDAVAVLAHELLEEWTRSLGMKTILNTTSTESRVRAFKKYGYELYRYTTRKDLAAVEGQPTDIQQ